MTSRFLIAPPDLKRAEKLALSENRTAANKYYTAHVNAIRSKYASLQQEGHEAVEVWVKETLEDVAEKHTVRHMA